MLHSTAPASKSPLQQIIRKAAPPMLLAALSIAGCQTTVMKDGVVQPHVTTTGGSAAAQSPLPDYVAPEGATQTNVLDLMSPCDAHLQDIGGLLIVYWNQHKRLPAKLEDIAGLAASWQEVNFTCPFNSKPYIYLPQSLNGLQSGMKLVAYSPVAGKDGRWRAWLMDPSNGITPKGDVRLLTTSELKTYLKAVPADPAAAPSFAGPK